MYEDRNELIFAELYFVYYTETMKKIIILCLLLLAAVPIFSENNRTVSIGIHLLAGGRYDNVRMCVGSPKGIKGGPIMEIYVDIRFALSDEGTLTINIPVMRPILFGAAFKMLQFEPQVTYEHRFQKNPDKPGFLVGGGLGIIFHYGPDFNSTPEERGDSFFSIGPLITGNIGMLLEGKSGTWIPGLKAFYSPLFSADYVTGHVFGGGFELRYEF